MIVMCCCSDYLCRVDSSYVDFDMTYFITLHVFSYTPGLYYNTYIFGFPSFFSHLQLTRRYTNFSPEMGFIHGLASRSYLTSSLARSATLPAPIKVNASGTIRDRPPGMSRTGLGFIGKRVESDVAPAERKS